MTCLPTDNTLEGVLVSALPVSEVRTRGALAVSRSEAYPSVTRCCLATTLSGLMMSGCYWPVNAHWLAWMALVPWLVMLPTASAGGAWLYGMGLGLVFYGTGAAWLLSVHGPLAAVAIIVLAVWMGSTFRVARLLMDRFSPTAMLWALPLAFVGQEYLRCEGFAQLRFPFLALGYSQSENHWIAQIASIGGVYGVSFLIVLVNATIAWGITRRSWRDCVPAVASIAAVLALAAISQPGDYSGLPRIRSACIQVAGSNAAMSRDLAQQAVDDPSRPRLVVLPEHTIAGPAAENHAVVRALAALASTCRTIICVGAHTSAPCDAACDFNNVAMLIGSDGRILGEQPKLVPLPFCRDGVPGRTQSVTPTEYGTVGTYVCFDGLFTDIPRRAVEAGAEVLLVPNMDDQTWPAQERWQHADMAAFRSIELRRCAVRANGAGISQIIDATGRVTACRTQDDGPGIVLGDVYRLSVQTAFVRGGHLLAPAVGIGFVVIIAWLTVAEWHGRIKRRIGCRGIRG
ncbi:MAG TPA: nitrilase-related carbon-nitrogen hydrolase [Phycisphaerae bacterium]|nr:nitrilase-related carbon-nitrogen hydrolase [Phycisphaerae bacterium]